MARQPASRTHGHIPTASPAVEQKQFRSWAMAQSTFPSIMRVPSPTRTLPAMDLKPGECARCRSITASQRAFSLALLTRRTGGRWIDKKNFPSGSIGELLAGFGSFRLGILLRLHRRGAELSLGGEFLPCQFGAEILFLLGNVFLVAARIDERVRAARFHKRVLFFESEVAPMGTQENIAWQ